MGAGDIVATCIRLEAQGKCALRRQRSPTSPFHAQADGMVRSSVGDGAFRGAIG
jgi:hypothetical protein